MNEICTVCGRYFNSTDYPPRLCPICEEEALKRGEPACHLLTPKRKSAQKDGRP
jgi:hypothetical protein